MRWGQIDQAVNIRQVASEVYRPDIYRNAAAQLGIACPPGDYKTQGTHVDPWTLQESSSLIRLGADRFCDLRPFDPANPIDYLHQFPVGSMVIDPTALTAANA